MDLKSGSPFWMLKNAQAEFHPPLTDDHRCDVLIVGAGITAALIARALVDAGMQVCLIDKRQVGWGSTAASTALLQYEIDVELQSLARTFGIDDAVLAYRACEQAVESLTRLTRPMRDVDSRPMQSLYFSSHWYHDRRVRREGKLRKEQGFALECLDNSELQQRFGLDAGVGLLSAVAAEVDPVQLARRLLKDATGKGVRVFERTCLKELSPTPRGVNVTLANGKRVRCKHVVMAAGYESQGFLSERVARNRSSYAFASDPMPDPGFLANCMVWESARPYLYARSTLDHRLIIGGEDDSIDIPLKRDASVGKKSETLKRKFNAWFPALTLDVAFSWAGTFAETKDGLPFFGPHQQYGPRVHFAMAYGGNGITYSAIGADIIRDTIQGKTHPCARLFSFERLRRK
ncbi:NAD(P)/FAD-dependent oxidoreductase [Dokdonella sp.]|uniref:NAD(P)/FAD-dependent oxidoreductase n=1 Tax=Dokdonella sp. TaxID=2291710 RepID=UPI003C4E54BB